MNGVLVVDKPAGLTSHDVVASARRALGERSIGHTGTLDPLATGVLPLACGQATRLVRFLSATQKTYTATVRFGLATDTYDTQGQTTAVSAVRPSRDAIEHAVSAALGDQLQAPPAYSAKRVGGERAYALARRSVPVAVPAAPVTLFSCTLESWSGEDAVLTVRCSAGFYVRSLAHELGQHLGSCACLAALRRTQAGAFGLGNAVSIEALVGDGQRGGALGRLGDAFVPMARLLPDFPAVRVAPAALSWVTHGRLLVPSVFEMVSPGPQAGHDEGRADWTRLLDGEGNLLGMARPGPVPGTLHPAVVLH